MTETGSNSIFVKEGRQLTGSDTWPRDTALFLMTYAKNEKYIAPARQNIDMFWPNHPAMYVVTDGALQGDDVICHPGLDFAHLLRAALDDLAARQPEAGHVYLLLEDLAPLGPVDEPYLRAVETAVRGKGGKFFNVLCHGSGKQRALPLAEEILGADAARLGLRRIKDDATAYNCLVACYWEIGHLRAVLDHKIATGQTSPWQFEHPDADQTEPHFMAEDCWPTFRSGFLKLGRYSKHLDRPHNFPASPLLDMVQADYRAEGTLPERLRKTLTRWERHARYALNGKRSQT